MENQDTTPKAKAQYGIYVVIILVVIFAGLYYKQKNNSPISEPKSQITEPNTTSEKIMDDSGGPELVDNTEMSQQIVVEGGMFYFKPNEIRVKLGDTVKIRFLNKEGIHDFVLDEFNAKTKMIKSGQSEDVEFVADKAGEFEFYCSVGNHKQMGMVGKLIVE